MARSERAAPGVSRRAFLRSAGLLAGVSLLVACQPAAPAASPTQANQAPASKAVPAAQAPASGANRVSVGQTNPIESQDPYNHSDTFLYGLFCEVAGCLVGWDSAKAEPVPQLAESWKTEDPKTWVFNLRQGVKWSDGSPFTSADVIHSLQRVNDHPAAKQKYRLANIASFTAPDDHTVKVVTKEADAEVLDGAFIVGIAMTSKAQADKGDDLGKVLTLSTGPYMLKEWQPNSRVVVGKNPNWYGGKVDGPDEVVYRYIKEDEARVTALINNEIQIASNIPSQDVDRVNGTGSAKVATGSSLTIMFLGMSPKFKPWDNKTLRQAVEYAIDKDSIIKNVLQGYAERLDTPIGPGQYAYDPNIEPKYTFDAEKAKTLVSQAGFPNGVDVELTTPVNMYTKDKEVTQAMIPMLNAVGIRAKLNAPDWSTMWADVQAGKTAFYYMGRGQVRDPGQPLSQYFETGVSPRLGYSDPTLDGLFKQERAAFEPDQRKKLLGQVMSRIQEEAMAAFQWRYKLLWGVSNGVQWEPRADEGIYANDIRTKA